MIKHNQVGAVNGVVISLIFAVLLLFGAIGFGAWAFTSREDYKKNSDAKVAAAVDVAKQELGKTKDLEFAEKYKQPLTTYNGPETSGSLKIMYPKTWSGYVDINANNSAEFNGYFAPGVVPSAQAQSSVFSLRVQVVARPYAQSVREMDSQRQAGKLTATAYALPKLPKVTGLKVVGQLNNQKNVTMVMLPLRSQTLQIWTEGDQYVKDFETLILPNFSFSP